MALGQTAALAWIYCYPGAGAWGAMKCDVQRDDCRFRVSCQVASAVYTEPALNKSLSWSTDPNRFQEQVMDEACI